MSDRIDIGHSHAITYTTWAPDDLPENRERYGVPLPDVEKAGLLVYHPRRDGKVFQGKAVECIGHVTFDLPELRKAFAGPKWKVESWEPLTLSPSLLCNECGDHGFVRGGTWVPA